MSKRNLETCEFETRKKLKGAQKFYYEEGVKGDSKNPRKIKKIGKKIWFSKSGVSPLDFPPVSKLRRRFPKTASFQISLDINDTDDTYKFKKKTNGYWKIYMRVCVLGKLGFALVLVIVPFTFTYLRTYTTYYLTLAASPL